MQIEARSEITAQLQYHYQCVITGVVPTTPEPEGPFDGEEEQAWYDLLVTAHELHGGSSGAPQLTANQVAANASADAPAGNNAFLTSSGLAKAVGNSIPVILESHPGREWCKIVMMEKVAITGYLPNLTAGVVGTNNSLLFLADDTPVLNITTTSPRYGQNAYGPPSELNQAIAALPGTSYKGAYIMSRIQPVTPGKTVCFGFRFSVVGGVTPAYAGDIIATPPAQATPFATGNAYSSVSELPPFTNADWGKVLGLNATTGALEWTFGGSAPPAPTTRAVMTALSYVVGDSMSVQPGYVSTTSWPMVHASRRGFVLPDSHNLAIAGAGSRKVTQRFMAEYVRGTNATTSDMLDFNNFRLTTDPSLRIACALAARRARLAVQFAETILTPAKGNTDGQFNYTIGGGATSYPLFNSVAGAPGAPGLSDWGSMTMWHRVNDPANSYANAFLRTSVVAGETVSFSLTGSNLAIMTWGCAGTELSRFSIAVDGTPHGTYDPSGRTDTAQIYTGEAANFQAGIINDAIFLLGLGSGSHTVMLTFLDAGRMGALDGFIALKAPDSCESRRVYLHDIPLLGNDTDKGYNYPGYLTARAGLLAATAARWADTAALRTAGYSISQVSYTNYTPETDSSLLYYDEIHESNAGHIAVEADVYAAESVPLT